MILCIVSMELPTSGQWPLKIFPKNRSINYIKAAKVDAIDMLKDSQFVCQRWVTNICQTQVNC